jgi:hypothetical protein
MRIGKLGNWEIGKFLESSKLTTTLKLITTKGDFPISQFPNSKI